MQHLEVTDAVRPLK